MGKNLSVWPELEEVEISPGFLCISRFSFCARSYFVLLCVWQHWFQDRIHEDIQAGKRPCREEQQCPACLDIQHTLVIALWRNPYDWVSAMQTKPHHSIVSRRTVNTRPRDAGEGGGGQKGGQEKNKAVFDRP